MKVIYQSNGGATKKLAETISNELKGIECWDLAKGADISKIAEGELIFLGSGSYGGQCGDKVKSFILELGKSKKKVRIALFGTSPLKKEASINSMRKIAEKVSLTPIGYAFSCPCKFLFLQGNRPNEMDLNGVTNFAQRMTKN